MKKKTKKVIVGFNHVNKIKALKKNTLQQSDALQLYSGPSDRNAYFNLMKSNLD